MKETKVLFRTIMLTSLMMFIFSACKKNSIKNCNQHAVSACSEDSTKTNIRITNISKYDFCNVVLDPVSGPVNCGIIKKGETTCYRSFDTAYHYAYIRFNIGDKEFKLQPIDYVGEQPLGIGKFTYAIDIHDYAAGKMDIGLIPD